MQRQFRYLDALTTAFVVVLLVANLVAQKLVRIGPVPLGGGLRVPAFTTAGAVVLFPLTYIFGDIFTEVYGYAASRRAIWLGFFATALMYGVADVVIRMPAAPAFHQQQAFEAVFGILPRVFAASMAGFWAGEFANSYVMAKMKLWTDGRRLWTRTVGSTVVGQAVDTAIFMVGTFAGTLGARALVDLVVVSYVLKVGYEVVATPLTYLMVGWLKRVEGVDAFDRRTDFNPFRFAESDAGRR